MVGVSKILYEENRRENHDNLIRSKGNLKNEYKCIEVTNTKNFEKTFSSQLAFYSLRNTSNKDHYAALLSMTLMLWYIRLCMSFHIDRQRID